MSSGSLRPFRHALMGMAIAEIVRRDKAMRLIDSEKGEIQKQIDRADIVQQTSKSGS